jgi:hypothetical protein
MNANQEAKLNMYRTTENYCNENTVIISANPAFMTAFTELKAKIVAITTTLQQESLNITGITKDKNKWKVTLCESAADMAGVIYAYAVAISNDTLKQEVNYSLSALTKTREESLAARCQNIHDAAVANQTALLNYGITTAMITDLEAAIANFSAQTPKPRTAISQRKTLVSNLVQLFKEADAILQDRMDKIVVTFKAAHPDFVKTYESARKIVDPPHTTTQLKGTVTDKTTATPIKDAKVTIIATPETVANNSTTATADPITVQTDASGEYLFKPLPFGEYTMTVTASGYTQFDSNIIDVKLGEVNEYDVALSN